MFTSLIPKLGGQLSFCSIYTDGPYTWVIKYWVAIMFLYIKLKLSFLVNLIIGKIYKRQQFPGIVLSMFLRQVLLGINGCCAQ